MQIIQTVIMAVMLILIISSSLKVDGAILKMSIEIQKITDHQAELDRRVQKIEDKVKP